LGTTNNKDSAMYWVILELKSSKRVFVTSEASIQSAVNWIERVMSGRTEPVRIELLKSERAESEVVDMDQRGMRAMKLHRSNCRPHVASWPTFA
jgi:hypothetical protein